MKNITNRKKQTPFMMDLSRFPRYTSVCNEIKEQSTNESIHSQKRKSSPCGKKSVSGSVGLYPGAVSSKSYKYVSSGQDNHAKHEPIPIINGSNYVEYSAETLDFLLKESLNKTALHREVSENLMKSLKLTVNDISVERQVTLFEVENEEELVKQKIIGKKLIHKVTTKKEFHFLNQNISEDHPTCSRYAFDSPNCNLTSQFKKTTSIVNRSPLKSSLLNFDMASLPLKKRKIESFKHFTQNSNVSSKKDSHRYFSNSFDDRAFTPSGAFEFNESFSLKSREQPHQDRVKIDLTSPNTSEYCFDSVNQNNSRAKVNFDCSRNFNRFASQDMISEHPSSNFPWNKKTKSELFPSFNQRKDDTNNFWRRDFDFDSNSEFRNTSSPSFKFDRKSSPDWLSRSKYKENAKFPNYTDDSDDDFEYSPPKWEIPLWDTPPYLKPFFID